MVGRIEKALLRGDRPRIELGRFDVADLVLVGVVVSYSLAAVLARGEVSGTLVVVPHVPFGVGVIFLFACLGVVAYKLFISLILAGLARRGPRLPDRVRQLVACGVVFFPVASWLAPVGFLDWFVVVNFSSGLALWLLAKLAPRLWDRYCGHAESQQDLLRQG